MSFSAIPTSQILTSAEKYCFFTPAQLKELSFVMEGIEKDPARQEQFFRDYATFIERKEWDDAWGKNNQEDKGGIRLAVTLAAVEEVIARRKEEQTAPLECLLESLPEIRVWMEYHEESYGKIGLEFDNGFAWIILRIFPGSVLRFGRLECNRSSFFGDVLYFENRITRERKAMLNGIYPFDAKGRITEKENAAFFSIPAGARCFGGYAGNLIRRNGSVEKEVTVLENNEWKCILHPGDEVLYLHIPAGGPLTDVEDSLKRMKSYFFHLPDYHPKAFICSSWLFSPVLQEILGESSNLLHFQNIFQQIPAVTTQGGVISRVFGGKAVREGIRSVPWNTTLRKKIGEILERGENFPAGRVLLFPDEIEE